MIENDKIVIIGKENEDDWEESYTAIFRNEHGNYYLKQCHDGEACMMLITESIYEALKIQYEKINDIKTHHLITTAEGCDIELYKDKNVCRLTLDSCSEYISLPISEITFENLLKDSQKWKDEDFE